MRAVVDDRHDSRQRRRDDGRQQEKLRLQVGALCGTYADAQWHSSEYRVFEFNARWNVPLQTRMNKCCASMVQLVRCCRLLNGCRRECNRFERSLAMVISTHARRHALMRCVCFGSLLLFDFSTFILFLGALSHRRSYRQRHCGSRWRDSQGDFACDEYA